MNYDRYPILFISMIAVCSAQQTATSTNATTQSGATVHQSHDGTKDNNVTVTRMTTESGKSVVSQKDITTKKGVQTTTTRTKGVDGKTTVKTETKPVPPRTDSN